MARSILEASSVRSSVFPPNRWYVAQHLVGDAVNGLLVRTCGELVVGLLKRCQVGKQPIQQVLPIVEIMTHPTGAG